MTQSSVPAPLSPSRLPPSPAFTNTETNSPANILIPLDSDRFRWTRLLGLSWLASGHEPRAVRTSCGLAICDLLTRNVRPLLVGAGLAPGSTDFTLEDHSLDCVAQCVMEHKRSVLFTGVSDALLAELGRHFSDCVFRWRDEPEGRFAATATYSDSAADQLLDQAVVWRAQSRALEHEAVVKWVNDCLFELPNEQRLPSTPLRARSILESWSIISKWQRFAWTAMMMADQLERSCQKSFEKGDGPGSKIRDADEVRLLAVSLRGSTFGAAIRVLSDRFGRSGLEVVDRFGPEHEPVEDYHLGQFSGPGAYIYIGDFIAGGTELKLAEAYAHSKNAVVTHAVVIGSWLSPDKYSTRIRIDRLVDLSKGRQPLEL